MWRWLICAALLMACVAWAGKAAAGGLNRIGGIGPRAGAMGGAYTAVADDASLFYYNPAGLTQFREPYAEVGGDLLFARFSYEHRLRGQRHSDDFDWHVLPLLGYVQPLTEDVVAGLGVYVPYGMGASFENNRQMLLYDTESLICLTNISPAIAVRFEEQLSLGLSLDIGWSRFKCQVPFDVANHYLPVLTDSEGDGWGLGASVGVLWRAERFRLGARYSTDMSPGIDGTTAMKVGPIEFRDHFESRCHFPERFQAGMAFEPDDRWLLTVDAGWYGYSGDMENLTLHMDKLQIKKTRRLDWDDNYSLHAGAARRLNERWTLRAGYTYVKAAVPDDTVSTLTPDASGSNVSFGFEYDRGALDVGTFVLYGWGERAYGPALLKEEISADIFTFGFKAGWRF